MRHGVGDVLRLSLASWLYHATIDLRGALPSPLIMEKINFPAPRKLIFSMINSARGCGTAAVGRGRVRW